MTIRAFAADVAACRKQLREGSKSFAAAAQLLPHSVADAATVLYAFCREADDAVDLSGAGGDPIARLRARIDGIYAGRPLAIPCDRALSAVVERYALPRTLLDAMVEGFEWDRAGRRYETLRDLEDYAARVAGTVGAMMSVLMDTRAPSALARACDLGVAMQLTNIARDVGEDARAGRLYLPQAWMREAGLDPDEWLAAPRMVDPLRAVIGRLLDAAEVLYARVDSGVAQLPPGCRSAINAARLIYAEIGVQVRRAGCDSVTQRAVVPGGRKAVLLARAFLPVSASRVLVHAPPLEAVGFLVDAVTPRSASGLPRWWHFRRRVVWLIDLFSRLERRERLVPEVGCDG